MAMHESPRVRRLRTDFKAIKALKEDSSILRFTPEGRPPESYIVRFRGKGLMRPDPQLPPQIRENHEVRIALVASYPRTMPEMQWLSPIYHPNISAAGMVCLGGYGTYWVPSLNLDELCEMLWDMIRYANYDVTSPYNRAAADWAATQRQFRFPLDPRPIRDKVAKVPTPSKVEPRTTAPVQFIDELPVRRAESTEPEDPDIFIIE